MTTDDGQPSPFVRDMLMQSVFHGDVYVLRNRDGSLEVLDTARVRAAMGQITAAARAVAPRFAELAAHFVGLLSTLRFAARVERRAARADPRRLYRRRLHHAYRLRRKGKW